MAASARIFIVLFLCACPSSAPPVPTPAPSWGNQSFVAYPGARELCYEHATGDQDSIFSTAMVSTDPVDTVVAFYRKTHPELIHADSTSALSLQRQVDQTEGLLDVYAVDAKDVPSCGTKPAPRDVTLIMVSTMVRE
jgi:hypothetical protein